jgi:hypothetical protein
MRSRDKFILTELCTVFYGLLYVLSLLYVDPALLYKTIYYSLIKNNF